MPADASAGGSAAASSPLDEVASATFVSEGGQRMRKAVLALVVLAALGAIAVTSAGGAGTTATGTVFVPNPVQSTGDESLTDQKDSDAAVPALAYYRVPL